MKSKNIIIIVIVLIVMALIAAIANTFAKNKKNSDPNFDSSKSADSTSATTKPTLDYAKKLGIGSRGEEVKELQLLYNKKFPSSPIVADGIFGAKTLNAVIVVMGFGTTSTTLEAFKTKIEGAKASEETKSLLSRVLGITF